MPTTTPATPAGNHAPAGAPAAPTSGTAGTALSASAGSPAVPSPSGGTAAAVPSPSAGSLASSFDRVIDRRGTGSLKWDFAGRCRRPADALPLWVADMDHATAPAVVEALRARAAHGIFGYTEPDEAYASALVSWFSRRYHWQVDPAWNTITPGVVPALALAVRAYTAPGEAVIIEEPVYYPFREVVEDNGRIVAAAPLVRDAAGVYRRDLAALEGVIAATGARLLILCNPHNPVGRVWTRAELEALAEVTGRHGVRVVADEIHADLTRPGVRTTLFASLSPEVAARTITCTSPSKSFNLAGLQTANILIADRELRTAFRREVGAVGYAQANALGLVACQAAYEEGEEWLDALREHVAAAHAHLTGRLESIPGIGVSPWEGTYLLWLDCHGLLKDSGLDPRSLDDFLLTKAGLWLDDGLIFGAGGQGFTRINVACPRAALDEALDRLQAAVAELLASRGSAAR